MKTISINLYEFDELSDESKKNAIESYREKVGVDTQWYWSEAIESIKKFHEIFPTKSDRNSWLDFSVEMQYDEMTGHRLQRWFWNNFSDRLFKGLYYNVKCSTKNIRHPRVETETYKNGNIGNFYYSAIQKEGRNCVLTGVCYDDDLLGPIYDFLDARSGEKICGYNFDTMDAHDLFGCCFHALKKSLEDEDEYRESDEGITDEILGNEREFTENGELYL